MPILKNIKNVIVGLTGEGHENEPSDAIGCGLSPPVAAAAHLPVQAASPRLVLNGAFAGGLVLGFVAEENQRNGGLSQAKAERVLGDAARAGVACRWRARN